MWDHLFGTWYAGSKLPSGYGIPEQDHVERPLTQWLIDVWVFYSGSVLWLACLMRSGIARIPRTQPMSPAADTPASIIPAE